MTAQTKHQVKVVKKNKDMNQLSATSNVILNIVFILAVIITVAPIWVIIMASFTSEKALQTYGYGFWPQEWSTYAYTFLFSKGSIIGTAYKNTIIATVVGTILCVISVGLYAYPISRKDFRWRNVFTFISFFTMLFNAGTVPFYVTCRQILGIGNSVLALFLPMSFSAYWVIIMRTFYQSNVPDSIIESARIDGAGEVRTFTSIVFPMIKPGVGALAIFTFITAWNDYFLQLIMLNDMDVLTISLGIAKLQSELSTDYGLIMAGAALGAIPIIIIFLIFQKFFTRGITMGAVKG